MQLKRQAHAERGVGLKARIGIGNSCSIKLKFESVGSDLVGFKLSTLLHDKIPLFFKITNLGLRID